jgi:hypothetical protein
LISDMSRHRIGLMSAGKGLVQRCRLYDTFVRKLFG